ncbi:hypothetical protein Tco_0188491 [Tanacetum coccineum]
MWSECVLTAVYLINKTPSSALSEKLPYKMIFKTQPNLSHSKVFRCFCFSIVLNNADKFFSRDVKFYETVFLFKNRSENKEYDLELKNLNGLKNFNNDLEEDLSNEPYEDGRDSRSERSKGTDQLSQGGTKNTDSARRDEEGHHDDSISVEADCDNLKSDENDNHSEGDDTYYQNLMISSKVQF